MNMDAEIDYLSYDDFEVVLRFAITDHYLSNPKTIVVYPYHPDLALLLPDSFHKSLSESCARSVRLNLCHYPYWKDQMMELCRGEWSRRESGDRDGCRSWNWSGDRGAVRS